MTSQADGPHEGTSPGSPAPTGDRATAAGPRRVSDKTDAAHAGRQPRVRRTAGARHRPGHVPRLSVVREQPPAAADLVPGAASAAAATTGPAGAEDAACFARIADGDRDAFAELYRR